MQALYRAGYFKMDQLAHSVVGYIAILTVYTIMYVYSYGTPIRVWDNVMSHTRMGCPIRVWDVPYAYGPTYAYRAEQGHHIMGCCMKFDCGSPLQKLAWTQLCPDIAYKCLSLKPWVPVSGKSTTAAQVTS